jgi:3,4-dihydroxy 2-butanone 4-phosphate synthase/GTP cyclohydrolase II
MPEITVEQAIDDIGLGRMVIVVDDEDRENEGDLVMAAEKATPEAINFIVRHSSGIVCVPMTAQRLEELHLPMMVQENTARQSTAFTVSVDALEGTTTGVSAHDRWATIQRLIDPDTKPEDLGRPGHIFPLRYAEGGVLVRAGHTEAAVDLSKMAALHPSGVLCELVDDDGSMMRMPELLKFSDEHGIGIVSIASIIAYRREHEKIIERVAEARLPTTRGEYTVTSYRSLVDKAEHVALVLGEISADEPVLVRVHSECLTGDVFGSLRCDCGEQVDLALQAIEREGKGVFLYMRQEGRGIGIHNKIKAYHLQDLGLDTVDANVHLGYAPDIRHYGVGAQILDDLGVRRMRILTNNPRKLSGLDGFGLEIVERVPIKAHPTKENSRYLETKRTRLGHLLDEADTHVNGADTTEAMSSEVSGGN